MVDSIPVLLACCRFGAKLYLLYCLKFSYIVILTQRISLKDMKNFTLGRMSIFLIGAITTLFVIVSCSVDDPLREEGAGAKLKEGKVQSEQTDRILVGVKTFDSDQFKPYKEEIFLSYFKLSYPVNPSMLELQKPRIGFVADDGEYADHYVLWCMGLDKTRKEKMLLEITLVLNDKADSLFLTGSVPFELAAYYCPSCASKGMPNPCNEGDVYGHQFDADGTYLDCRCSVLNDKNCGSRTEYYNVPAK